MTTGILFLIALALFFDFLNGFHDAANSIATVVATRVLSPNLAVMWAASFSFLAFLVFGTHVAGTIGKGLVHPGIIDSNIMANAKINFIILKIKKTRILFFPLQKKEINFRN